MREGDAVARAVVRLAGALRARGVRVGPGQTLLAQRALAAVDASQREQARLALRAALCAGVEDLAAFDAAFRACFGARAPAADGSEISSERAVPLPPAPPQQPEQEGADDDAPAAAVWSAEERLRHKDFADYDAADRRRARRVWRRLARRGPQRPSRRLRPRRAGARVDVRRSLRAALRTDGELLALARRGPSRRPRRLVVVCDVSASMRPYAAELIAYLEALVRARRGAEAFVFGTRLTRVTRELAGGDPQRALRQAAETAGDWAGGTRIGAALATLTRAHARELGRGAIVVVLSDGWDCGEPELLAAELARLRRCAHRLVWCNPLAAQPGYEPLTRGMRAALAHSDVVLPGNTLASFEQLAQLLAAAGDQPWRSSP